MELSKWTHNCPCSSYLHVGHFPFNQNIWFEFPVTSNYQQMEQHFPKFSKRRTTSRGTYKFSATSSHKFFFHLTICSHNFQNLWLNGLHFRNSTVSRIFGNFSGKIQYHLVLFPNLRMFWLNRKRPQYLGQNLDCCIKLYVLRTGQLIRNELVQDFRGSTLFYYHSSVSYG